MKKILIIIFVLGFSFQMKAQLVVSDPTNTAVNKAGWIESIAKAGAQVQTLLEQKNLLTQSINMYMKVSSSISDSKMVFDIIDRQVRLISMMSREMTRNDYQSSASYNHYKSIMQQLMADNKTNVSFVKTLVSPEVKMTDAERLRFIRDLDKESRSTMSDFYSERDRYNDLNENLRLIKSLKSKK